MFDTNAISALVHHRAGWEQFARRIDGLTTGDAAVMAALNGAVFDPADPNAAARGARLLSGLWSRWKAGDPAEGPPAALSGSSYEGLAGRLASIFNKAAGA